MRKVVCGACGFDDAETQHVTVYDDDGKWGDVVTGRIQWFQRICPFPRAVRWEWESCHECGGAVAERIVRENPGKIVVSIWA